MADLWSYVEEEGLAHAHSPQFGQHAGAKGTLEDLNTTSGSFQADSASHMTGFPFDSDQGAHCTVNATANKRGAPGALSYNVTADSFADQALLASLQAGQPSQRQEPTAAVDEELDAFNVQDHKALLAMLGVNVLDECDSTKSINSEFHGGRPSTSASSFIHQELGLPPMVPTAGSRPTSGLQLQRVDSDYPHSTSGLAATTAHVGVRTPPRPSARRALSPQLESSPSDEPGQLGNGLARAHDASNTDTDDSMSGGGSRKRRKGSKRMSCRQCGTHNTPQWRMGPDGPRTLCNACGVRYTKVRKHGAGH
ncbi:hypothetical protein WJX73_010735 [Symbiochloris irregularis]|uniref:GATA-type domain-containing protein n=1 Tax=Symbiochloris irregularis TaxID=706552 RepID=A0AAW1NQ96_9CHLO